MLRRRGQRGVWSLVVMVAIFALALPAVADDIEGEPGEIQELRQQLERLEADTDDEVAADEFETAFTWLEEAEQLVQSGSANAAERRVRRVDHMLDMLRALVQTRELERTIEAQREAYATSKERIESLEEEIASLEAEKENRQQDLERILEDLDED